MYPLPLPLPPLPITAIYNILANCTRAFLPLAALPFPGRFFLLGITVICLPLKRLSFNLLAFMAPSLVWNSMYANLLINIIINGFSAFLPFWLIRHFIYRYCDSFNFSTFLEMLFQFLRFSTIINILDKDRSLISIIQRFFIYRRLNYDNRTFIIFKFRCQLIYLFLFFL